MQSIKCVLYMLVYEVNECKNTTKHWNSQVRRPLTNMAAPAVGHHSLQDRPKWPSAWQFCCGESRGRAKATGNVKKLAF